MSGLMSGKVPPDVLAVCRKLRGAGHEAHLVGGGVRDMLLGRVPADFDVNWLPDSRRLLIGTTSGRLVIADTRTGQHKELPLPAGFRLATESVALSRDGKKIFFGAMRTESDIWMVERAK